MKNDNKNSESQNLRQKAEALLEMNPLQDDSSLSVIDAAKLIHELKVHQIELELQNNELILARFNEHKIAEKYTELYDLAPSGYFTLDNTGEILECNLCGSQMFGQERSQLKGRRFALFVSVDTRSIFNIFLDKVFQTISQETCEVKLITKGDGPMHVLLTGIMTENQMQCNITMVDITLGKQLEEKLLFINKAVESTGDAIGISDARGRHIYQNTALSDLFGYATAEELQAAGGGARAVKDPGVAKELFDCIMSGKPWSGELEMVTKSGHIFTAYERADAITDRDGNIAGLIGVIQDITGRKQAEETLRSISEFNHSLLKTIPFGMNIVDENGNVLFLSDALKQHFGEDAPGKKCWDLYRDDKTQCSDCPLHAGIQIGETKRYEIQGVLGGKTFENYHTGMMFNGKKAMLEVFIDITERKRAEEEIQNQLVELRRWYEVTLDREGRVLELKQEVNELLKQHGKPIRYESATS